MEMPNLEEVASLHIPLNGDKIVCDICGEEFETDSAAIERGTVVIGANHGVFWACEKCSQRAVVDTLREMEIWK